MKLIIRDIIYMYMKQKLKKAFGFFLPNVYTRDGYEILPHSFPILKLFLNYVIIIKNKQISFNHLIYLMRSIPCVIM